MFRRKALALATLSTIVCGGAAVADDGFKSSKFLTYPAESQSSYIGTAVMMAGVIASKNVPEQARCIDKWAATHIASGYQPVIEAMQNFPEYHPTGVIIAVLQKSCGSFDYAKR
ncbi:hypothetical protein [Hyphomicrobium sp.]|uniref:hypothetical protein n=1 Tax=Hyphomicrobium sp. TaxID=82 RepID=UPI003F71EA9A